MLACVGKFMHWFLSNLVSSSSAFDVMVALTRSSLLWVPHTWMSGTNPLQTPRAWFWGTHKWAISAAVLVDAVSRTVGSVLVFGPPLHRGIERRSLRQSSWDGYSVCSGLFWGERWWSVGVMAADGVRPGLGCILQSCSGPHSCFWSNETTAFIFLIHMKPLHSCLWSIWNHYTHVFDPYETTPFMSLIHMKPLHSCLWSIWNHCTHVFDPYETTAFMSLIYMKPLHSCLWATWNY